VRVALEAPFDFPPLRRAVTPDDHVAVVDKARPVRHLQPGGQRQGLLPQPRAGVLGGRGGERLAALQGGMTEPQHPLRLGLPRGDLTLTALPEENVEGRPAAGVKAACRGQPDVSIWFDKQTGLPVKTAYRVAAGPNQPASLSEQLLVGHLACLSP
jgi:hypothetical protein